ncbi:MAG: glycosyltransferase family 2 protein, partial [Verrucomicrobiota bacterium]
MASSDNTDKPVLFLLFNRPDLAGRVFEEIRKAAPPRLYFNVDGPRPDREGESDLVQQCRRLAEKVDWECDVFTQFHERNLGCGKSVSSGIFWFFESEESGIILEDDCLPAPSFFPFVTELLDRYRDDERVMHIGGSNHQRGAKRTDADYYFSRYEHVWGWGSWSRAWQK